MKRCRVQSATLPRVLSFDIVRIFSVAGMQCSKCSDCFKYKSSIFHIRTVHLDITATKVYCRTVQYTHTNKDLIYAATPPPY